MCTYADPEGVWRWTRAAAQPRGTAFCSGHTLIADRHGGCKPRSNSRRTSWTLQASACGVWPTCKAPCDRRGQAPRPANASNRVPCVIRQSASASGICSPASKHKQQADDMHCAVWLTAMPGITRTQVPARPGRLLCAVEPPCCPLLCAFRNLHWVFKVGDRTATVRFYTDVLLMEPLRHEEVGASGGRDRAQEWRSLGLSPFVVRLQPGRMACDVHGIVSLICKLQPRDM